MKKGPIQSFEMPIVQKVTKESGPGWPAGTLEEMIYTRQVYKQQQSAVATEGSKETRYFYGTCSALACICI